MKLFPFNAIEKCYNAKVDAAGLGVFRIAYGGVLFSQVLFLLQFRYLIFMDPVRPDVLIYCWLIATFGVLIGFQTRICTVLNYVLSVIIVLKLGTYSYDFDKIMISMNFLMMFIPVGKAFSVDRLLKHGRGSENSTSILSYYIPVLICLGFPYLDSGCHKILSDNWTTGIGIWAPMAKTHLTRQIGLDYSFFVDNKFLVYFSNYLIVMFELCFVFLFWFREIRMILLLIGIGMHVGIFLIFPIPLFAIGCVVFYILLLPPNFFRRNKSVPIVHSDEIAPSPLLKQSRIKMLCIGMLLIFFSIIQVEYLINYFRGKEYMLIPKYESTKFTNQKTSKVLAGGENLNDKFLLWCTRILGIGNHKVFVDHHVNNSRTILAIVYKIDATEEWLPIITPEGHPGRYLQDRVWSRWTGYVMGPNFRIRNRLAETANLIEFWCLIKVRLRSLIHLSCCCRERILFLLVFTMNLVRLKNEYK